jgi:hypothetical protein
MPPQTSYVSPANPSLSYYLQRGENLRNFPPDFRMIAGDNRLRNFTWNDNIQKSDFVFYGLNTNQAFLRQKAIGFNCLNYDEPANAALGLQHIPQGADCKDGLRAEVFFPSCWNGKDSDSPDHRSHVAYPSTVDDGVCPEGFEHRLPSLFFETIWDVGVVTGKGGRLVFSNGDATGTLSSPSCRITPPRNLIADHEPSQAMDTTVTL